MKNKRYTNSELVEIGNNNANNNSFSCNEKTKATDMDEQSDQDFGAEEGNDDGGACFSSGVDNNVQRKEVVTVSGNHVTREGPAVEAAVQTGGLDYTFNKYRTDSRRNINHNRSKHVYQTKRIIHKLCFNCDGTPTIEEEH